MDVLLTSQWDDVFQALQRADFDPREFERDVEYSALGRASVLRHASSAYFVFLVDGSNKHFGRCSPGESTREQLVQPYYGTWHALLEMVGRWLGWLRREVTAFDLWGQLAIERELIAPTFNAREDTPFSPAEQAEIQRTLVELKSYASQSLALNSTQYGAIESQLDYLADAATRLNRNDWRTLFVGALVALALEAVVPPDAVRGVLVLGLRALAHMFGIDVPQLPTESGFG